MSSPVALAYDALAADYDRLVAEDGWMRRVLWAHYRRCFVAGDRVLDVGCGTGLDTLFLARRGVRVTGLDLSPGMIARLRAKAEAAGLAASIELRVGDAARLETFTAGSFDGAVSAFAGLNTVDDLDAFAAALHRVLAPGGRAVFHLLAPAGLWERRKVRAREGRPAARALGGRRERTVEIAGRALRHHHLPARETYRASFARRFRLRRAYGLGFLWPRRAGASLPAALAAALGRLEAVVGRLPPFLDLGRFFVLDLEARRCG